MEQHLLATWTLLNFITNFFYSKHKMNLIYLDYKHYSSSAVAGVCLFQVWNKPIQAECTASHCRCETSRACMLLCSQTKAGWLDQWGFIVQELCESRGGRPGLSVLTSLLVSEDVKLYWTVLRQWSQLVPNTSTDIRGQQATLPTYPVRQQAK